MNLTDPFTLELFGLLAQADVPAEAPPEGAPFFLTMMMWLAIFGLIYFMFIRPISKAKKDQQQLVSALKNGSRVITVGGIVGIVTSVKDKTVLVRTGDGTKIEVLKDKLASVEGDGKGGDQKPEAKEKKAEPEPSEDDAEASEEDAEEANATDENGSGSGGKTPYNRSRRRRAR
ncbi:MAG: preprotein translocase subunit YajC, partial [Verrucomicrobiota bacterium]